MKIVKFNHDDRLTLGYFAISACVFVVMSMFFGVSFFHVPMGGYVCGAVVGRFLAARQPLTRLWRVRRYRKYLARQPFGDGDPYRTVNRQPHSFVSMHVVKDENYIDKVSK